MIRDPSDGSVRAPNNPKEDSRERLGMWAPGNYYCQCVHCNEQYIGDKRSVCCADCAYKSAPDLAAPQNTAERLPSSDAAAAGADTVLDTATSGLQTGSEKPENLARLQRSREWLADYRAGKIKPKSEEQP